MTLSSHPALPAALCGVLLSIPCLAAPDLVKSVTVNSGPSPVSLATQVGAPYDAAAVAHDVHSLWNTGRFADVHVAVAWDPDGAGVTFNTAPKPHLRLREIRIEPHSFALQVKAPPGSPIDAWSAHKIALEARNQLNGRGYLHATVRDELIPRGGGKADLRLTVDAGQAVRVKRVEFTGDLAFSSQQLRSELRALRIHRILPGLPRIWNGWRILPDYNPEAVESDIARVRAGYLAAGYFDATVTADPVSIQGIDATVTIRADAGPKYSVRNSTATFGEPFLGPLEVPYHGLCTCFLAARREAQREGILDFSAVVNVQRVTAGESAQPLADVTATADHGRPFRIGRIEFTGNHHYADSTLRRNFLLDEGDLLDSSLLRKSLANLNRMPAFGGIDSSNVVIVRDEGRGVANVNVRLTERKRNSWNLSGPVGPASLAGPLEAAISTRLPAWGKGIFELSTYTASISLLAFAHPILPVLGVANNSRFLPLLILRRPFFPAEGWTSGFSIAPQLGWPLAFQQSAFSYANTQLQERLQPLLRGDSGEVPGLPVTVQTSRGESAMYCEPPKPKFHTLRTAAGVVLRLPGAVVGF